MEPNIADQNISSQSTFQQIHAMQPVASVSDNNNHQSNKKRVLIIIFLIVLLVLATLGGLAMQKSSKSTKQQPTIPQPQTTNSPTSVPTASPTLEEITWVDNIDSQGGFSFKYPKGWDVVYATLESKIIEIDVTHPDKKAYVLVVLYSKGEFKNESDIKAKIITREKDLRSDEKIKVIDFTSSTQGNTGSFTASGEEIFFNLTDDEKVTNSTFKFQDKGSYSTEGKSVVFHGATLPGEKNENIITKIIDSFEIK